MLQGHPTAATSFIFMKPCSKADLTWS